MYPPIFYVEDKMNSKSIATCEWCDQAYCQECTDAHDWKRFCSQECEVEHNNGKEE